MKPAADPVLDVAGLAFSYGERGLAASFALRLDRLVLRAGEAVGVVGPSGCGKSTLLELLALLRPATSVERHRMLGQSMPALFAAGASRPAQWRASRIGMVLQSGGLLPGLSALENIRLSQRLLGVRDEGWVATLLARLGLDALAAHRPAQLSAGQRQRVAIARALAHRPALILADEPTAALGIEHAPAALDLLLQQAREAGAGVLVVSHDHALLASRQLPCLRAVPEPGGVTWKMP